MGREAKLGKRAGRWASWDGDAPFRQVGSSGRGGACALRLLQHPFAVGCCKDGYLHEDPPSAWAMGQGRGSAGVHGAEVEWFGQAAAHRHWEQKKMSSGRLSPQLFSWGGAQCCSQVLLGLCFNSASPKLALCWPGSGSQPQSRGSLVAPSWGQAPTEGRRTVCSVMFNQDIGYVFKPEF